MQPVKSAWQEGQPGPAPGKKKSQLSIAAKDGYPQCPP